jgi:zinc protease
MILSVVVRRLHQRKIPLFGLLLPGLAIGCVGPYSTPGANRRAAPPAVTQSPVPATAVASTTLGALTIRTWRLENGLEIVTVPDGAARSVSYVTTFRVGSRDENAATGETGLAHLFEHLMFRGTRGAGTRGDFDQRMEEVGASCNAITAYDFTSYIDELPLEALDRAISLEADRMINLDLDAKQVANERDVVIEERLESVEDSVDGVLDERMYGQAFRTHPYKWPVIGRLQDVKAITREKALAFYRRHYTPDRAVIVVAGPFDEVATVQKMAAAYGTRGAIPASTPPVAIAPERAPATDVRVTLSLPVPADRIAIGYPAPSLRDPDRAAYELLFELLLGGPSSRLHRLLIADREIASSITGDVAQTRDPALGTMWIQMTRKHEAREAEELILREVERLINEPVSPSELEAAKNRVESAFWQQLAAGRGRAEALGQFEVTTGDLRNLIARGSGFNRVTAADIARAARVYLGPAVRSVVIARPMGGR